MPKDPKKKSAVRGFEREERVRQLVEARVIQSPEDVPAGAIPASLEMVRKWRASLSTCRRDPFYQDIRFQCEDCGHKSVWTAQDQRHWYELLQGSPYSRPRRCAACRRKRRNPGLRDQGPGRSTKD